VLLAYGAQYMRLKKLKDPADLCARMIPPEELVKALTPEELAKALTPEQLAKALTPEQLTEFLDALPLEMREQIKRRLH
jgi:hypothetical protein